MGYVIIQGQDGEPDKVFGLENPNHETIMICDACNEPRLFSDGYTIHQNKLDLMWMCRKCGFSNCG